jgi:molybdenum-dependent DNA-binding transcriptional regulator ModE
MDENNELEQMIESVKGNKEEVMSALNNSHEATLKKLKIMKKNIKRVFDELEKYSDTMDENSDQSHSDDTESTINKINKDKNK